MTKERRFKKEYAKELLSVASEDLEDAIKLHQSGAKRKENVLFLCQQSLEKALKAGLCALELPVPLIHDLALLLDRYPKEHKVPVPDEVKELTEFATIRRYEGSIAEYSDEEIKTSFQVAKEVIDFVKSLY